ncbi:MAG: PLP-dependent aminotransferase family protein [Marinomonas sp.]|nr:MAG: PLP-dependent aminotransferase family protein [Marinomonas sp.]
MIASLSFSLESNETPRYQQLQQQLLEAIEQGRLAVGDKLPSSRTFARSLGVSRSVVIQTYEQLIAEGVLRSEPKRGIFVAPVERILVSAEPAATLVESSRKGGFDSGVDVSQFPSKEWAASMRRAWLTPDPNVLMGSYRAGLPALRQAIVAYLYALRGLSCLPEQVVITAGSRDAMALLAHALQSSCRHWFLEEPTYPPLHASLANVAVQPLAVQSDGALPPTQVSDWTAVLTPNRQYPLGISYSSPVREQWLDALQAGQGFIIEDDYDNEFLYQGRASVPLMQLAQHRGSAQERIFYVGSLSKVLFRGLRMGFIIAPLSQVDRLLSSQQALGVSASLPMQPVVADFMTNGSFYRHLNRMRRHYREKRDALLALLSEHLEPWFEWDKPSGGMHVIAYFKSHIRQPEQVWRQLDQACAEQGLALSWLHQHYHSLPEPLPRPGLLLGFTGPSTEQLDQWVRLIALHAKKIML